MSFSYYDDIKLSNSQDNFNAKKEKNNMDQIKGIPKLLETLNRNIQDIDSKLNSTRGKSQTGRVNIAQDCNDIKNIVKQSVEGLNDIFNVKLNKSQLSVNNNPSLKSVNPLVFSVIKEETFREVNNMDDYNKTIKQEKTQNNVKKFKTASTEAMMKTNTLVKRDSGKMQNVKARMNEQDPSTFITESNLNTNSNMQTNNSLNYSYKINKHKSTIDKKLVKKNNLITVEESRNKQKNLNTDVDTSYSLSTKDSNTKLTKNIRMLKEKIENKISPQNTQASSFQNNSTFSNTVQSVSNSTTRKHNSSINDAYSYITSPTKQNLNNRMNSSNNRNNTEFNLNKITNPQFTKTLKRTKTPKERYDTIEEDAPLNSEIIKPISDKEFFDTSKIPLVKDYKLMPKRQFLVDNEMNTSGYSKTAVKKNSMPIESVPESFNLESDSMSETKKHVPKIHRKISNNQASPLRGSVKSKNSINEGCSCRLSDNNTTLNEFYQNTLENTGENGKKNSNFFDENTRFNFQSFHQMSFIINELARHKNIQGFDEKILSSDLSELFISLFNHNSDRDLFRRSKIEKRSKYNVNKVIMIQTLWRRYYIKRIFENQNFPSSVTGLGTLSSQDGVKKYLISKIEENKRLKQLSATFLSCIDEFNKIINTDRNFNDILQDYILISKENVSTEEENHVNRNLIRREAKVVKKFGPKIEKNASTQVKKDNFEQSGRNLRKTGANPNSTAVSNPSELSGRSFNNERCPEVETFSPNILVSKSQVKSSKNTQIKSPKVISLEKKNPSGKLNRTHDTEMELRLMKKELEKLIDL